MPASSNPSTSTSTNPSTSRWGLVVLVAAALTGCASIYSSIEREEDGSYHVTRIKQGFFNVSSQVYSCVETGEGLSCRQLND